ncbi:hypothetical protein [Nitriliruptor alkaliphilus]|nr:hypothetical protein [Nitriliruptor alkaliphilus]
MDDQERVEELCRLLAPHRRDLVDQHEPEHRYIVAIALLELQMQVDIPG